MQDLNVVTVQANQVWEDKAANLTNYERLLKNVEAADLIILPEMFQTGFTMNSASLAEKMDGESVAWLKKLASEKQAAVYTSLIIEENGGFFNRGIFVKPDGELSVYDKRHLFGLASEDHFFSAGKNKTIVNYKGWNINLQVCYDLRFPENCRNREIDGKPEYDLLLYVANWPERRVKHWSALLLARAIENQSYVVGVNRVGTDANDLNYNGSTVVVNALGEIISNHSDNSESVGHTLLYAGELRETRIKLPFLKDVDF